MNKLKSHLIRPPPPPPPPTTASATTKSFNATINRLSGEGHHRQVLLTFTSMLNSSIPPDVFTYPSLIKACTSLSLSSLGLSLHQHLIVNGFSSDAYISSSLINFYARIKNAQYARKLFDMMPERNIVPWTAMIGCYSRGGNLKSAFFMYNSMQHDGIRPSPVAVLTLLSGVSESAHVDVLHACMIKWGLMWDTVLMNCMVSVYAKCGRVEDARELFEFLHEKDIVSWNSLINAYSAVGNVGEVVRLLYRMKTKKVEPDQQTFGSLVSAVAKEGGLEVGRIVHGQVVTSGFESDKHVGTSVIVMYGKCGNVDYAFRMFESAADRDTVLWTAMISAFVQNDCADKALALFQRMLLSRVMVSGATMACVLAACGQLVSIRLGASIHCYMLRRRISADIATRNSLVSMYAKCGHLEQSLAVFNMMKEKDVVSWNAIVAGYAQNGYLNEALHLFNEMRLGRQRADSVTVVSLLQASASIGAYQQGKWIHSFVVRSCLESYTTVGTALVDMYSKCGDLGAARKCFDRMPYRDVVSWSTIIAGYGSHGKGDTAIEMYSQFLHSGLVPNDVMFLSLLYMCSHNGLVDHGMNLFESMKNDYKIEPKLEHCACIVDLLCRAGRVQEAYGFYKKVFSQPVIDVLGILLDACRTNGQAQLTETIAKEISELEPSDAGKYVQLANSFASMSRWEGVGEAWVQMRSLGLKKFPGWSFIEIHDKVTFFTRNSSHDRYADVVVVLRNLTNDIKELIPSPEQEDFYFFDCNVF